jgi:hypothetical protein
MCRGGATGKLMTLPVAEFLQRWLFQVPPPGLQVVRSYGLYAPTKGTALRQSRQALGQGPVTVPQPLDWQSYCAQQGLQHPECCPVCGQRLIRTATLAPQLPARRAKLRGSPGASPDLILGWLEAA